jgi:hypothetical protein
MRDGLMPAIRPVLMARIAVHRTAVVAWMLFVDRDHVLVHVIVMRVMQVAIVQVVDVIAVTDGRVATVGTVLVLVDSLMYVAHARDVTTVRVIAQGRIGCSNET